MDQSEIQQRVARLNTFLRFGRQQAALTEAYKLRIFIQLCGKVSEDANQQLQRTERVIAELENTQASGIQRLVGAIIRTAKASLNPENDRSDESLLDLFSYSDEPEPVDAIVEVEEELEQ